MLKVKKKKSSESIVVQLSAFDGYRTPAHPGRLRLLAEYQSVSGCVSKEITLWDAFTACFRESWLTDRLFALKGEGKVETSRGNWTSHTAIAMHRAARMFGLRPVYEAEGRVDCVLYEDIENQFVPRVLCEWEWDTESVFEETGEVCKLANAVKDHPTAFPLLVTYVDQRYAVPFAEQLVAIWRANKPKSPAPLVSVQMMFEKTSHGRLFDAVRVLTVHTSSVELWDDLPYPPLVS